MAKSLQDQLKQAGLASQKQIVKARKAKNTKEKMQRKGAEVVDETAESVKRLEAEKLERDRALNREKTLASERKAQIRQIIELNTISERGEVKYQFDHNGVIKMLMLSDEHRQALVRGSLAIVGQADELTLVPAKAAEKIAERDASWLVVQNQRDESSGESDDDYAGYAIPDDLMW